MCICVFYRQTPVEILHTILLGPVKYLVKKTFQNLSAADKRKVKAKIEAFDFSAFPRRLSSTFIKNYGSSAGRDFKLWAQIAVFILDGFISDRELLVWFYLCEVRRHNKYLHAEHYIYIIIFSTVKVSFLCACAIKIGTGVKNIELLVLRYLFFSVMLGLFRN